MAKLSARGKDISTPKVVLASQDPKAREMFAGKSLLQIADEYDLDDKDVKRVQTGGDFWNLCITIDGVEYLVPFSRSFPEDGHTDPQYMLQCVFRETFKSVKDENGNPVIGDDGKPELSETEAYLSFGKPTGITITEEEELFVDEAPKAAAVLAGGGRKGATAGKVK